MISPGAAEKLFRKENESRLIGCFVIVGGLVLFFNAWGRTLENHDYLRYAEVAREMIRSGEWIVPHYNGQIYLDKPPLLFWLIAIPSLFYGSVTPIIARLPSIISAWAGSLIVCLWGRQIYGNMKAGIVAGGILLSTYQYFFQARIAKTDMLASFFVLCSLYFFYRGYRSASGYSINRYVLSFLSMGLGFLTKGPVGLIPLPIIALYLWKEKRLSLILSKGFFFGYLILLLTVSMWVLPFLAKVGMERAILLFGETQILTRRAPFFFYFTEIWGQYFPWSLFIPLLAVIFWRDRKAILQREDLLLLVWFGFLFVVLTLFEFKASRYLLLLLPPFALVLGGNWRKGIGFFLIVFVVSVSIWHGLEIYRTGKNFCRSPGMVVTGQLASIAGKERISSFRLDFSTLEEINFYLDRIVPVLQTEKDFAESGFVIMPLEAYASLSSELRQRLRIRAELKYKGGKLVLGEIDQCSEVRAASPTDQETIR